MKLCMQLETLYLWLLQLHTIVYNCIYMYVMHVRLCLAGVLIRYTCMYNVRTALVIQLLNFVFDPYCIYVHVHISD